MKIDLLLDPFGTSWGEFIDMAVAAEALGFNALWTWDHLAGQVHQSDRVLECWTVLSAVAARTDRIMIGPLVLNVANRNPAVAAVMASTLQEVSNGRLLVGVGAGGGRDTPYWREQAAIGLDVAGGAERSEAVIHAIATFRSVWTGSVQTTGGAGEPDVVQGFLRPAPIPPILVGGFSVRMAEIAGMYADGFNTHAEHPDLSRLTEVARNANQRRAEDGAFEISGFARLGPDLLDGAAGLDRLIAIASPRDGIAAITDFADSIGLMHD